MGDTLWTAVDCACGKVNSKTSAAMSLAKDKSLALRDPFVDELIDAFDLLAARVDAVEYRLDAYWEVINSPLSPAEAIQRLRDLREAIDDG